jgi:4-amino-4-deoxy-L-arabinose transferase-like glycosyltransferase
MLQPHRFGAYHDDGIYVTTAKSLAEGQGYRIISLPYEPAQTKYPPLYPLLLSLIWRASHFPENLAAMMWLSVAATVGFLVLSYHYLHKHGYASAWQALFVVGLAAVNWRTMILATSIYSEMVYAALSVWALHLAEDYRQEKGRAKDGLILGIVLGLTFLTRTSGVALIGAVGIYYFIKKDWKRALLPVGVAGTFVAGWVVWCAVNKTAAEGVNVAYYTSYLGHLSEVVRDLQAQNHSSALAVFLNIAVENFIAGILISVPLICSGANYSWIPGFNGGWLVTALVFTFFTFILIVAGFIRQASEGVRLLHIYVISCFGLYLFWLPDVSYDRFLMPLLPFLLLFFVRELTVLGSKARRELRRNTTAVGKLSATFIGLTLFAVAGVILYNYSFGIYQSFVALRKSASRAAEDAQAIAWINANTQASDALVCYRDPMYFLYTGHRATRSFPMKEGVPWQDDQASLDNLTGFLFRIVEDSNARYVITTSSDFELEDQPERRRDIFNKLLAQHADRFIPVFESADARSRIYRVELAAR